MVPKARVKKGFIIEKDGKYFNFGDNNELWSKELTDECITTDWWGTWIMASGYGGEVKQAKSVKTTF